MSLGAPRKEVDKSGQSCLACDVAINSIWYADTLVRNLYHDSMVKFTNLIFNYIFEDICKFSHSFKILIQRSKAVV